MNILDKNWKTTYKNKITDVARAVEKIGKSDYVVLGHAAGIPQEVTREILRQKDRFENLTVFHMLGLGEGEEIRVRP